MRTKLNRQHQLVGFIQLMAELALLAIRAALAIAIKQNVVSDGQHNLGYCCPLPSSNDTEHTPCAQICNYTLIGVHWAAYVSFEANVELYSVVGPRSAVQDRALSRWARHVANRAVVQITNKEQCVSTYVYTG
jgi:hypothetical protein